MKKLFSAKNFSSALAVAVLLVSVPARAGKYDDSDAGKVKLKPNEMGNVVFVLRGEDKITVNFHQARAGALTGALMVGVLGGVGGIVGGVAGAALSSAITPGQGSHLPATEIEEKSEELEAEDNGKKLTLAEKDQRKEQALNLALGGWTGNQEFFEKLMEHLKPVYQRVTRVIADDSVSSFQEVEPDFYKNSRQVCNKISKCLDYTPLINEGVDTVIEIRASSNVGPKGALSKEALPIYGATAKIFSLKSRALLTTRYDWKVGAKCADKFEKLMENNAASAKSCIDHLIDEVSGDLAKKLQK